MSEFNRDRQFKTGADRSADTGKPHFERALSPLVLQRFAEYMRDHNIPAGRREDQWQLGFPDESWIDSGWRHFHAWWCLSRGIPATDEKGKAIDIEEAICGLFFNVQGALHQILLRKYPENVQKEILEGIRTRNVKS